MFLDVHILLYVCIYAFVVIKLLSNTSFSMCNVWVCTDFLHYNSISWIILQTIYFQVNFQKLHFSIPNLRSVILATILNFSIFYSLFANGNKQTCIYHKLCDFSFVNGNTPNWLDVVLFYIYRYFFFLRYSLIIVVSWDDICHQHNPSLLL